MIVGYVRVSVKDNGNDSIINQINLIKEYSNNNNYKLDKIYIDNGISGITYERHGFQKLKQDIIDDKISIVIVKDISRLGREKYDTSYYINEFFPSHNVKLISLDGDLEDVIVNLRSIMNEQYVKDASIKRKSVAFIKTMNHEYIGVYPPFGYDIVYLGKRRTLVIKESEASIVRLMFKEYLNGKSMEEIIAYLCDNHDKYSWNSKKVLKMLKNVVYKGDLVVRKSKKDDYLEKRRCYIRKNDYEIIHDVFPSIVSNEVFDLVNKQIKKYKSHIKIKEKSPIENKVFCGKCFLKMRYYQRYKNNTYQYYFKCLKCNKTIFSSMLNKLLGSINGKVFENLNKGEVICSAIYKGNVYIQEKISLLTCESDCLVNKNKELYLKKIKNILSELEFVSKYNANLSLIDSINLKLEKCNSYDIAKFIDGFDFKLNLYNAIDRFEIGDVIKIFLNIKKA